MRNRHEVGEGNITKKFIVQSSGFIALIAVIMVMSGILVGMFDLMLAPSKASYAATTTTTASGYPGPTTTTQAGPSTVTQNLGTGTLGSTVQSSSCGFNAGAAVTITVNGSSAGSGTASSTGCVSIPINVLSVTSSGGQVQVNGSKFTVNLTNNQLSVVGTGSNGNQLTVNNTFAVSTSSVPINGTTGKPFNGEILIAGILIALGLLLVGTLLLRRKSAVN